MPQHRHDHEEVFTVVAGSVTTVLDGEEFPIGPGDTVIVNAGTEHFVYTGEESADLIAAVPAGTIFIATDGTQRIAPWAT
jgi:quercetin dioxygenase-like cupin family protein